MLERRRYAFWMPLASGAISAGHTILRLLGWGGMGEVYFAHHPRLPRREPLKILSTDVFADDAYRRRFIGDAGVADPLAHPNIVCVSDRGESNRQLWISMDLVDGTDAATLLRDRYPVGASADQVAAIIAAIASALGYAYQHRDLIPNSCVRSGRAGPASDYTWGVSLSKARQVTGPSRTGTLPCLLASPGSPASPATPVPWLPPSCC
jgi:serine/threonine protein kinase